MSRPYQHNFDTPHTPLNRQGPSNPTTPSSAGGQATSFKTNVNRAKTKRWVEAPSYSYDGDDWGEVDDYDEYGGYDEPPEPLEPPRSTGLGQQGQSINQAPPNTYDASRGPPQELMDDGRRAYGHMSGHPPAQQQSYGSRSATNLGQPRHSLQKARSNSFDRGDERRAFSAGGAHYTMAPTPDATAPSYQERNPVINPQTSNATNFNPASAPQDNFHTPPRHSQSSRQGPPGPPLQVQTGSNIQGQARGSDQAFSPTASYRGVSYSDHGRHPTSGSRAQSMTSNTSSLDFHGRRDFSPSALPQPLQPHVSAGPQGANEAARFPPRQSSLSQQGPPYAPIGHETHLAPDGSDEESSPHNPASANNAKPLPFVRPADIYKRMEEERERERQSQDSARPTMDAIMRKSTDREPSPSVFNPTERSSFEGAGRPSRLQTSIADIDPTGSNQGPKTNLDPLIERKSEHGFDGAPTNNHSTITPHGVGNDASLDSEAGQLGQILARSNVTSEQPVLPDVGRVSGFGESFFKPSESAEDHEPRALGSDSPAPLPSSNDHLSPRDATIGSLQHQPSLGFRTVVKQAFDDQVPPTPSSLADSSVARTNSESTSGVSPIMSRGPSAAAAHPALKDREAVPAGTRTITEALDEDSARPTSMSTFGTPKTIERKPSPSLASQGESGVRSQPSFIPGHRRNISTPSPDNSPARTPALEINRPMRQPQEVEMAMVTPIEASLGTDQDSSIWERARDLDRTGRIDYTTREADLASAVNESAEGQTSVAADAVKDARASFLETRRSNHIESPTAPVAPPSTLRAESPGKNRVRDLAGMFENGSHSKSGSEHSSPLRGNSFGANTLGVDDAASRPAAGRLESFRPRLPGGWESFASTAPSIAPYISNDVKDRGTSVTPGADANITQDTNDDIDMTPTTVKRGLSKSEHDFHGMSGNTLEDPFSAVAVAGSALAGALAAVVGLGSDEDATDKEPESSAKPDSHAMAGDFGAARGRSASIQNTAIHPEASKTLNRSLTADSSSGAPTPPPKDTPLAGNESAANAGYFATVEPLKNRPRSQVTTSDQATPPARPPMLPYMSTDIKPQDLESDRLRKEIVRSLSPITYTKQTSNAEIPSSVNQPLSNNASLRSHGHDSMIIPSEYDSYWNEPNSEDGLSPRPSDTSDYLGPTSPVNHSQVQALAEKFEQSSLRHGDHRALASTDEELQTEEDMPTPPAALSHRFSWEQEPAGPVTGSGTEPLGHPRSLGTEPHATSVETREQQETALNNPTEFQERQSPTSRDVLNAEGINQATSELPATEQGVGTGLSGHTMNLWGPAAVPEPGYDTISQHNGSYNKTNQASDHGSNFGTVASPVVGQIPTSSDTHHEVTPMQASRDPYSYDPYANDPYADNAHSLPPQHGFEGQSSDVPPFDNQESSSQHPFESLPSHVQALNYEDASPQHELEDQYGEAQATRNLLSTSSQHSPLALMNIVDSQNQQPIAQHDNSPPLPPPPAGAQPRILAFREILALQTAADRIRAYNATREQFANMNTGLAHWITVTVNETPEHAGLLSTMGRPSAAPASQAGTPTRSKLSGLRPAGAQPAQQPYYQQYLNASSQPTTPSSATASPGYSEPSERQSFHSSGGSGRVQAKGKDLLKNAGVFGGKANVAAKGLFSKGKSRFRSSGGGDKATNTNTSTLSPSPDSASRGMQPQSQPLDTFQHGHPATSTYQSDLPLPVQANLAPHETTRSLSTPSRPLSFVPSIDNVTPNYAQAELISEPRNFASSPNVEPSTLGADSKTQPSLLSREPDKFRSSSEEPRRPDGGLELSREANNASTHDRGSERPQEEAQVEEQSNPVLIGDAAPIFLQQTAQAESYVGSPKEVHSPQSATSSNRTPAQTDFPGPRRSNELRRSQVATTGPQDIPPVPIRVDQRTPQEGETGRIVTQEELRNPRSTLQSSGIRIVNAAIAAHESPGQSLSGRANPPTSNIAGSAEGGGNAWPPPNTRVEQPYSTSNSAEVDSRVDTTEGSRDAGTVPPQKMNRHSTPRASVQMALQDTVYPSAGGARNSSVSLRQEPVAIVSEPNQQARRPFSFVEYSSKEPPQLSRNVKLREPSIDSLPDEVHKNRPPSPVSPTRSLTKEKSNDLDELAPAQYGSDHDIIPVDDQSTPPDRHRSFSRPFKSPDIAQHPAFRQEHELRSLTEATDLPTQYYPAQIRREEAFLPRQQGTEYQLEGVGPPPVEPARSKSRSRRSSRSSGFFKNLGNNSKAEIPPVPTGVERQSATPPAPSSTSTPPGADKKSKRTSLFRSLTGHNGSGSDRSKESITAQAPGSRNDLLQQSHPRTPSADDEDFPTRGKSKKLRSKLQRNPTSGATEQESGKKKRFSALGSLFGRSTSSKSSPSSPVPQTAHPALPSQQLRYSGQRQQQPPVSRGPSSVFDTTQDQEHMPPPPGGYYAPAPRNLSPPRDFGIDGRRLSNQRQPQYMQPASNQPDPYQQQPGTYPPRTLDPGDAQPVYRSSEPVVSEPRHRRSENRPTRDLYPGSNSWQRDSTVSAQSTTTHSRSPSGAHSRNVSVNQESLPHLPSNSTRDTPYAPQTLPFVSPTIPAYVPSFPSETAQEQQLQPRPYKPNTFFRPASPIPPPPPPKDEWRHSAVQPPQRSQRSSPHSRSSSAQYLSPSPSHSRTSSLQPPPPAQPPLPQAQLSPPRSPHGAQRQMLPPLRTDVSHSRGSKAAREPQIQTPVSARKIRQMQIERAGLGKADGVGSGGTKAGRGRGRGSEEEIVMSSTSYPGQEWQPGGLAGWDGN